MPKSLTFEQMEAKQRAMLLHKSEAQIQSEFFELVYRFEERYPVLKLVFHIPNGGMRPRKQNPKTGVWYSSEGQKLQRLGVRKGVWDVFVCAARRSYRGFWMEFKDDKGKLSDEQKEFKELIIKEGYWQEVERDATKAFSSLCWYLELDIKVE